MLSTDYDNDTSTTSDIVTSYTYDLSGNQITETEGTSTTTYHYDDANWLQYVTDSSNNIIASYDYDANGQRTKKTVGTAETNYFYTGIQLLYTTDSSNAVIEQNILETDGSMICSKRANGNNYWYRQNIRGSVTNIVDVDDDVVKSYTYDEYGNTSWIGTFVNSFAYTGAVIDTETGLYYMNARYYEPDTGRFISQDTYRGDGEEYWNLYAYCDGDPVNATDPSGHEKSVWDSVNKRYWYEKSVLRVLKAAVSGGSLANYKYASFFLSYALGKNKASISYSYRTDLSNIVTSAIKSHVASTVYSYARKNKNQNDSYSINDSLTFSSGDLKYAFHKVNLNYKASFNKNVNSYASKWNVVGYLSDYFDFSSFWKNDNSIGTMLNNNGYAAQKMGEISNYWIYVYFAFEVQISVIR